jgi:hypothetical protein
METSIYSQQIVSFHQQDFDFRPEFPNPSFSELSGKQENQTFDQFIEIKQYLEAISPISFWIVKTPEIAQKIENGLPGFISKVSTFPQHPDRYFIETTD